MIKNGKHPIASFTMETRLVRCYNAYKVKKNGKQPTASFTMKTRLIRCYSAYYVNKYGKQPITSFSGTNRPKTVSYTHLTLPTIYSV